MANRKDSKGRVLRTGEYERKDGRYSYIYVDGYKKKCTVYAKTLSELREQEKEIQANISDGILTKKSRMTLNELFDEEMQSNYKLRESSSNLYRNLWDKNIRNSFLGNMKICDIKNAHIRKFVFGLISEGKKKTSITTNCAILSSLFKSAVESDYIRKNPVSGVLKSIPDDKKEREPLSDSQIHDLLDFMYSDSRYCLYAPIVRIAIGTGLRVGELFGLTWDDVNFDDSEIYINHQIVYMNKNNENEKSGFVIRNPKSKTSNRVIYMTKDVRNAFMEIKKQNLKLGRRCNVSVDGYTDFVILTSKGTPMTTTSFDYKLRTIRKAYLEKNKGRIMPPLSAHIFRHTACTMYATKSMDVKVLQAFMGHSTIQMTMGIYNHCSVDRLKNEMQRIEENDLIYKMV